jgi:hypothetical protein
MNIQKNKLIKRITNSLVLLIATTSMIAFAANNRSKDRELIIHVDPTTHCAMSVTPSVNENHCALLYSTNKNPCKNDPECVCSKKEKYISWQTTTGDKFNIHFTEGSPFKRCKYSAGRDGEVRCKIKNSGDHYYEINVQGCASNPYDPRIVVK